MKIRFAALFGALMLASASALAFHCPADMKKIDAALEKSPKLSAQHFSGSLSGSLARAVMSTSSGVARTKTTLLGSGSAWSFVKLLLTGLTGSTR